MNRDVLLVKAEKKPKNGVVNPSPNQLYRNPQVVVGKREIGKLGANDIRLEMIYVGICGSDLHLVKTDKDTGYIKSSAPLSIPETGRIIGHEGVGRVLEVGKNVKHIKIGMIVTLESILVCNHCEPCKRGDFNQCDNAKLVGLEVDGIMGTIIDVNASLAHDVTPYIKNAKDLVAMACIEPAGVAFDACEYAAIRPADRILILGGGPIGHLAAMMCKSVFGAAEISVIEPIKLRRELLKKITPNVYESIDEADENIDGIDVVVEASGVLNNIKRIFSKITANGRVVLLARSGEPLYLDKVDYMITNNIKIIGARGHLGGAFDKLLRLYSHGVIQLGDVVTTEVKGLNKIGELLESEDFEERNCKVVVALSECSRGEIGDEGDKI